MNPISKKQFDLALNLKAKDIDSKISNLESIIMQQNNRINELQNKIKEFEPMFQEYLIKKEVEKIFPYSDILNSDEKIFLLKLLPNWPRKINLLINSNLDGDSTEGFIQRTQNKSPTLVIIETTKGRKFGGYTTQIWKQGEIKDNNAFVFSLVTKKKYEILKPEHAICFVLKSFWGFGYNSSATVVCDNCTSTNSNFVSNKAYNISEPYELNGGERNFAVKSYEIYHID